MQAIGRVWETKGSSSLVPLVCKLSSEIYRIGYTVTPARSYLTLQFESREHAYTESQLAYVIVIYRRVACQGTPVNYLSPPFPSKHLQKVSRWYRIISAMNSKPYTNGSVFYSEGDAITRFIFGLRTIAQKDSDR